MGMTDAAQYQEIKKLKRVVEELLAEQQRTNSLLEALLLQGAEKREFYPGHVLGRG
jgi:hypothetical protein